MAEKKAPKTLASYRQLPHLKGHQDPHKNMDMEALLVPGGWPKAGREGKGGTMAASH